MTFSSFTEFKNSTGVLKLYLKDGKLIELMVESSDPNLSTEDLIAQWASSSEGSVLGTTAPRNVEVEQIEAPIIRKGPPPKDPEEETDGFADFALDEVPTPKQLHSSHTREDSLFLPC